MPLLYVPSANPRTSVAYDNSALSTYQLAIASPANWTWTHNPTTAGSYVIVAAFGSDQASQMTPAATTAVTFGGQTMTSLGVAQCGKWPGESVIWVWGLLNAPGGSNTVSVTLTEASMAFQGYGASFTYTGVASVGCLQIALSPGNSSAAVGVSVPSPSGCMVWGAVENGSAFAYSNFSLTTRQFYSPGTNDPAFTAGDTSGAVSVPVKATPNTFPCYQAAVGLNLSPR